MESDTTTIALLSAALGGITGSLVTVFAKYFLEERERKFKLRMTLFEKRVQVYSNLVKLMRELVLINIEDIQLIEKLKIKIKDDLHEVMFLATSKDVRNKANYLSFLISTGKDFEMNGQEPFIKGGKEINELELLMQKELSIKE